MNEPSNKRVSFFIDGQNLFHSAKKAFGYRYPNYNIKKLAFSVCAKEGWDTLVSIHFYTGIRRRYMLATKGIQSKLLLDGRRVLMSALLLTL